MKFHQYIWKCDTLVLTSRNTSLNTTHKGNPLESDAFQYGVVFAFKPFVSFKSKKCCTPMLHSNVSLQCCTPILQFNVALQCCTPMLHANVALQCYIRMLHSNVRSFSIASHSLIEICSKVHWNFLTDPFEYWSNEPLI